MVCDVVIGVGALTDPVPTGAAALVYHNNVLPAEGVAVSGSAISLGHNLMGETTTGLSGIAVMVVVNAVLVDSQPFNI